MIVVVMMCMMEDMMWCLKNVKTTFEDVYKVTRERAGGFSEVELGINLDIPQNFIIIKCVKSAISLLHITDKMDDDHFSGIMQKAIDDRSRNHFVDLWEEVDHIANSGDVQSSHTLETNLFKSFVILTTNDLKREGWWGGGWWWVDRIVIMIIMIRIEWEWRMRLRGGGGGGCVF